MKKLLFGVLLLFTLTACEEERPEYTVTFYDYDTIYEEVTVTENKTVSEPTQPVKECYTFEGWYTSDTYSEPYDFTTQVTEDDALYAKFSQQFHTVLYIIESEEFDVAYDDTFTYGCGETIDAFTPELEDQYIFNGWYTDDEFTTTFDLTTMGNQNYTVYGSIDIEHMTLTYDYMDLDIDEVDSVNYAYGETIVLPSIEVEGYEFHGWYYDEDYTHPVNSAILAGLSDVTVYALFEEIQVIDIDIAIINWNYEDDIVYTAELGVMTFIEYYDYSYGVYVTETNDIEDILDTTALAIEQGAEVIIYPGWYFQFAVYEAQTMYPDVYFILLDGEPTTLDYSTFYTASNTVVMNYKPEEGGFLAGYAAVYEGYTSLGFMGGMNIPIIMEYGIGYIAGAYYAADELGVTLDFDGDTYMYLGTFSAEPSVLNEAGLWYQNDTELIYTVSGGAMYSILDAAEEYGGLMLGSDYDLYGSSDAYLGSTMLNFTTPVVLFLIDYYIADQGYEGGQIYEFGLADSVFQIPLDLSNFETFGWSEYTNLMITFIDGTVDVPDNYIDLVDFLEGIDAGYGSLFNESDILGD